MTSQLRRDQAKQLVATYFKDDYGQPFVMSDGQADLFLPLYTKDYSRVETVAPTQYGKSSVIAMGLIMRSQVFHEPFAIVTGSEPKSQIIMEKVIQHTFDHPMWYQQLELDVNEPLDKLRRSRNKTHITWKGGGGVRTFTADSRNRMRVKEALTGFGSPNIIEDEASLIPDDLQAMILRMLGGHKGGFLYKIGNPFYRNHFWRTWNAPNYHKVFIDYNQALREGRYTQAFIDEMKDEPFFDILYECRFPEDDDVNELGYRRLLTDAELEAAFEDAETEPPKGPGRLGVDVAAGGKNWTVFMLRHDNVMRLLDKNRDADLMAQVPRIETYATDLGIDPGFISVDDVGVGHGVTNRLEERGFAINAVKEGSKASNPEKFTNRRAEMYWELAQWIKRGGKIVRHPDFFQLTQIYYKVDSQSRLKIEPKEDMGKRGIPSPDVADAASLTMDNSKVFTAADMMII